VFVNLRSHVPELGNRFERLVEVVTTDEPSRAAARQRWRSYVAQGLTPERHDVAVAPQN
jgi:DNA polymerase-3 subunit chi